MKKKIFIGLLVLGVLVLGVVLFTAKRRPAMTVTLKDGSVLRVEKVSFGKRENFTAPKNFIRTLQAKVAPYLPKSWAVRFPGPPKGGASGWSYVEAGHTNVNALYVWISRWDPAAKSYVGYEPAHAELVDEHGCVLNAATAGGERDASKPISGILGRPTGISPGTVLNWFRFEAFPRDQRQFRMRLLDRSTTFIAEFTIQNPLSMPPPVSNWNAGPLPVEVKNGDLTFRLDSAAVRTNAYPRVPDRAWYNSYDINPEFTVMQNGQPVTGWYPREADLWDNFGNYASKMGVNQFGSPFESLFLCPKADAWRLAVKFYGDDSCASASNAVWTMTGVKVPGPGEFQKFEETRTMLGATLGLTGFSGAGEVTYSNGVPVSARVSEDPTLQNSMSTMGGGGAGRDVIMSTTPSLALRLSGVLETQRLTIRARDTQGRNYYARDWQYGYRPMPEKTGGIQFLKKSARTQFVDEFILDIPPDVKTVDLAICVHNPREMEFTFKPPSSSSGKDDK